MRPSQKRTLPGSAVLALKAMSVEQHRRAAPAELGFSILTVSDTREKRDDASGDAIREGLGRRPPDRGFYSRSRRRGRDPRRRAPDAGAPEVDVVVTTGGTGFSPRDVTLDAVGPLLDQPIEGFGELFRMLSYQQVGAAAMLSRAAAGLVGTRAVFLLPGSPKAVALAMEALILPEAAHLLGQARRPLAP